MRINHSKIYITVYRNLRIIKVDKINFVTRARVKAGVKILDASSSSPDWIVESDINLKNTVATFTARRKENVSRLPNA